VKYQQVNDSKEEDKTFEPYMNSTDEEHEIQRTKYNCMYNC